MKRISNKIFTALIVLTCSCGLIACLGGGGGDSASTTQASNPSSTKTSTQFTVKAATKTTTKSSQTRNSTAPFQVALLDKLGNVLELITPENWSQNNDGSYSIELAGRLRADRVFIFNINGVPNISVGQSILNSGYQFVPTIDKQLIADAVSTAVFKTLLEKSALNSAKTINELAPALVDQKLDELRKQYPIALSELASNFDASAMIDEILALSENTTDETLASAFKNEGEKAYGISFLQNGVSDYIIEFITMTSNKRLEAFDYNSKTGEIENYPSQEVQYNILLQGQWVKAYEDEFQLSIDGDNIRYKSPGYEGILSGVAFDFSDKKVSELSRLSSTTEASIIKKFFEQNPSYVDFKLPQSAKVYLYKDEVLNNEGSTAPTIYAENNYSNSTLKLEDIIPKNNQTSQFSLKSSDTSCSACDREYTLNPDGSTASETTKWALVDLNGVAAIKLENKYVSTENFELTNTSYLIDYQGALYEASGSTQCSGTTCPEEDSETGLFYNKAAYDTFKTIVQAIAAK